MRSFFDHLSLKVKNSISSVDDLQKQIYHYMNKSGGKKHVYSLDQINASFDALAPEKKAVILKRAEAYDSDVTTTQSAKKRLAGVLDHFRTHVNDAVPVVAAVEEEKPSTAPTI